MYVAVRAPRNNSAAANGSVGAAGHEVPVGEGGRVDAHPFVGGDTSAPAFTNRAPGARSSVIGRCSTAPADLRQQHLQLPQLLELVDTLAADGDPGPARGHLHRRTGLGAAGALQCGGGPVQYLDGEADAFARVLGTGPADRNIRRRRP